MRGRGGRGNATLDLEGREQGYWWKEHLTAAIRENVGWVFEQESDVTPSVTPYLFSRDQILIILFPGGPQIGCSSRFVRQVVLFILLFIWLCWVLVVACRVFSFQCTDSLVVSWGISIWQSIWALVEKAMATHSSGYSSTLAWTIPWMEEPGRLQSMGLLRVGYDWVSSLSLSCIGEGNGNTLQYSCLENPRDGRAWWAAVYGVTQSRTRLKRLSSSSSSSMGFSSWGLRT